MFAILFLFNQLDKRQVQTGMLSWRENSGQSGNSNFYLN